MATLEAPRLERSPFRTSRDVYAEKALEQIPRLLSNQDRNPFSPTYGCFHRDYWLDKTSDFPDAVRQFAVHALALVYRHDFPGNRYRGEEKVRDWAIAGLDFWQKIQHRDGSFDEFYPFERGWVGPTAFTTFTSIEAFELLQGEMPFEVSQRVLSAIRRAATFIAAGESEEDHLANHHAMACLAVWKAYELLGDPALEEGFGRLWRTFLTYHREEGWSREYDGVDPGYLSATVSFLSKILATRPDPEMQRVVEESAELASYFVYPNGYYAGLLGSRNTLHFYPHGVERLSRDLPLAAAMAEKMRAALAEDKLVPPGLISDRYVAYRVPEFLQSYLDSPPEPPPTAPLPYERQPFTRYFEDARIFVASDERRYVIANLAKGGVLKVFSKPSGRLLTSDGGLIGRFEDGRVVTSQWVDPDYASEADEHGFTVRGRLQVVPSNKLFTPTKLILFRAALVAIGWSPRLCHALKAAIRRSLILGRRPTEIRFERHLRLHAESVEVVDEIVPEFPQDVAALSVGGEFFVRYVPQSRYFQLQELECESSPVGEEDLASLRRGEKVEIKRSFETREEALPPAIEAPRRVEEVAGPGELPEGVYDADYHEGRQSDLQLVYRLRRRTDEVVGALGRYQDRALEVVVDIGTADGLMLEAVRQRFEVPTAIGLDLSLPLLETMRGEACRLRADAQRLPLATAVADAVISTAVIEHVADAATMAEECARILRPGGLLVLTTPQPTMEKIASALGILKDAGHQQTFTLKDLRRLLDPRGFEVLEARKFMFSPVGFPAEKKLEKWLGPLGLRLVMANQLLVARRRG